MNLKIILEYSVVLFLLSFFVTYITRYIAVKKNIFDIPNDRSSHCMPTPRGGGIAIVLTFLSAILYLGMTEIIPFHLAYALIVGGLLIAFIGQCDDIYTVPARLRIIIHFLAALWAIFWIGGFSILDLGTWKIVLNGKGNLLALIGIVWCINLYNFMDGIDGLAGSEGLFVSLTSALVLFFTHQFNLSLLMGLFAAAIAGFTIWNWSPAKIFLGDVGSGFIGYVFAVMAIYTANHNILSINFWLILLAIFLCDATFTVVRRFLQGKSWYAAHREHAYQQLVIAGFSHQKTTVFSILLNVLILSPMALMSLYYPQYSFLFFSFTVIGLFLLWFFIIKTVSQPPYHSPVSSEELT